MSEGGTELADAVRRAKEFAAKMIPQAQASGVNGSDDSNSRKRPLDEGDEGPQLKKPSISGGQSINAQAIAQAAIAKVGAQLGLAQMITIEIKIPNRLVGLVIGRQGEMINKLQLESNAKIQVAPDGTEVNGERNVTICGLPDTVEKAKMLVSKVVEDAGGATNMPMNLEPGQEVFEVMIAANKVGLVIGKGGEMIKALQERAGCKMQMIQDGQYANAPEKPLRMTGTAEACRKARDLVFQLIEQKELEARGLLPGSFPVQTTTIHGGVQTIEVQVPKPLVGFVIGRNGEHINNIQNTCGVRLQFQNDVPGVDYRLATISGPPECCSRARKMVQDIVAERMNQGYKPHIELPNPTGPGVQTVQIPVPAQKCGLVIGKGGETIRQLQVQSGAHIELHRGAHPNPAEKLFNIRGTQSQIQLAQQLVKEKCEMMESSTGFPGQQMPGVPYQGAQLYPQGGYGQSSGGPWSQYPYSQAYGQTAAAQAATDPAAYQQAWAAYYQQLYTQQGQQPAQVQQGQGGAATGGGDLQAQWADYYRQLGYFYSGQQQSGGAGATGQPPNPGGANNGPTGPGGSAGDGEHK